MYREQGKYDEALPLLQRALKIREKALGPDDPDTAFSLLTLSALYQAQGNYAQAVPLLQRALKIQEKAFGPDDPKVARTISWLAFVYQSQGNFAQAQPLAQQALAIREKALGPEHPDTASSLNVLAVLYEAQGNYTASLPLKQRALKIQEKVLGPEHPDTATSLDNLAQLYRAQGNYTEALPLFQRALKIREKVLGPEHPDTATTLNNLAVLYYNLENYDEALPLYQRALQIDEKVLGPEHPGTADSLNNLALVYEQQENYAEAIPLLQRALKIREKALGPEHPDTAVSLHNMANLYCKQGNFTDALPLYQRAIKIDEKTFGPEHSNALGSINDLAKMYEEQENYAEALPLYQRAADAANRQLELTAAMQSERQQLANIQESRWYLDSFVSCALLANDFAPVAYDQMLAWKGAVLLRQRLARAARKTDDAEEKKLWSELQTVATRLATASRTTPSPEQSQLWRQQLTDLTQHKEQLEAELNQHSAAFRKLQTKLTADQLRQKMPADTALVDLLQFARRVVEKQQDGSIRLHVEDRLAAFIIRADQPVALIDLGRIEPINEAVFQWRNSYGGNQADRAQEDQPAMQLRKLLWEPLASHLEGIQTVLISPDGAVSKFPWGALPGDKPDSYLIEDIAIAIIPVPQMLPNLLEDDKTNPKDTDSSLLIVGDVDYGATPGKPLPKSSDALFAAEGPRLAVRGSNGSKFSPLPGTAKEIEQIERLYRDRFTSSQTLELKQSEATTERVRQQAPQHRYLHLATHGFYSLPTVAGVGAILQLIDQKITVTRIVPGGAADRDARLKPGDQILAVTSADGQWTSLEGKTVDDTTGLTRGPAGTNVRLRVQPAAGGDVVEYLLTRQSYTLQQPSGSIPALDQYQPGLLSGLVLAGANLPPKPDQDDGIITALEVASLDLQRVDLAVLSACETGLGQSAGGEGMLGLQRAFQVAGAKTTITSLWSVDDAATQTLMTNFYSRLWDPKHPLGKLEALRQAQLEMLRHYDPKSSQVRGIQIEKPLADSKSARLSPKYWAAFVLSGDWR